jgi:hypothetical protein
MSDKVLRQLQAIIQRDANNRGLAADPNDNLLTACKDDFVAACNDLQTRKTWWIGIVTGFYIPSTGAAETDGPLGAVFLARVLNRLGHFVCLLTEDYGVPAFESALRMTEGQQEVKLNSAAYFEYRLGRSFDPRPVAQFGGIFLWPLFADKHISFVRIAETSGCLIAIERAGPSHSLETLQKQPRPGAAPIGQFLAQAPRGDWDQYHTMRGHVITDKMAPAHHAFEAPEGKRLTYRTIGIGDGGNEIGMGKIPWETIAKNVPNGGLVACRVAADYNIVCGVSNWGAYGLAAGLWHLSGRPFDEELFSADRERELWEKVLKEAVLVDGVTGRRAITVDGLSWDDYIQPLREIAAILRENAGKPT